MTIDDQQDREPSLTFRDFQFVADHLVTDHHALRLTTENTIIDVPHERTMIDDDLLETMMTAQDVATTITTMMTRNCLLADVDLETASSMELILSSQQDEAIPTVDLAKGEAGETIMMMTMTTDPIVGRASRHQDVARSMTTMTIMTASATDADAMTTIVSETEMTDGHDDADLTKMTTMIMTAETGETDETAEMDETVRSPLT